jgi:hypothetical protein
MGSCVNCYQTFGLGTLSRQEKVVKTAWTGPAGLSHDGNILGTGVNGLVDIPFWDCIYVNHP